MTIVEFSDDGIITRELDGRIRTWNKGAEKIFGYRPDEVIGKHISLLVPDELLAEETNLLERLTFGLALFKRVIEVHGGNIWVESGGVGMGSCFCFELPLVTEVT